MKPITVSLQSLHSKSYENSTEEDFRQSVFEENQKLIEKHNDRYKNGEVSFKMAINQFGDLTHEEFDLMANGPDDSAIDPHR